MNMIFKRASVRKYLEKSISKEQIEILLKAGMAAPSARNMQPWEFIVVQDRTNLDKIMNIHPYSSMLKEAPLAIIVCGDITKGDEEFRAKNYWVQDCSAATQNIMLQAIELDLGSVWLGTYPKKELYEQIAKLFNLPEKIIPVSIIAIGYPAGEIQPKDKFDKTKIHNEGW